VYNTETKEKIFTVITGAEAEVIELKPTELRESFDLLSDEDKWLNG
jgi:hypothetical protein|tara:strand:- start:119 stop:256 length:138 start_codon:yes stop_codon:yes gene_type:complete